VPLHIAIHQNNSEAVELLLEEGANPNAVGEDGFTPLHSAVAAGNAQAVKLLLNYGALTDIKDNVNYLTPEEFAVLLKREDVLSEFKEFKRTRKK
jgi:ankyrin repeat protein